MNRLDTAYSLGLLTQSLLTKDNLIRDKYNLKEQVEYFIYVDTRVPFTTYAYKLTTSVLLQVTTPVIYTR